MEDKTNHSPDNRSEKYLYVPTEEDFMKLYHTCLKHTKIVKKDKTRLCIICELIAVIVYPILVTILSAFGEVLAIGFMTMLYPIAMIAMWFWMRCQYASIYRNQIRNRAKTNPFYFEKRWISFDGYHLISESDHMTIMLPIRDNVKTTFTEHGLILECHDGYRYYPIRIFGSLREMSDFYDRLNWNNEYKEKYAIK